MRLVDHTGLSESDRSALQRSLSGLGMLGDVVRWLAQQTPRGAIVDVIVQDEFTHDVVVSDGQRYLVFDAT